MEEWSGCADAMDIPYDAVTGVHPQDSHFLDREVWDLANTPADKRPLLLHYHPLVIYRFQVLKQADVVLALFLQGDDFTLEQKRADFEYYDPITTGDSTLSAVVQSIIAAEVGYRELALRYFHNALFVDLADLHGNTTDGVHVASTGGVWNCPGLRLRRHARPQRRGHLRPPAARGVVGRHQLPHHPAGHPGPGRPHRRPDRVHRPGGRAGRGLRTRAPGHRVEGVAGPDTPGRPGPPDRRSGAADQRRPAPGRHPDHRLGPAGHRHRQAARRARSPACHRRPRSRGRRQGAPAPQASTGGCCHGVGGDVRRRPPRCRVAGSRLGRSGAAQPREDQSQPPASHGPVGQKRLVAEVQAPRLQRCPPANRRLAWTRRTALGCAGPYSGFSWARPAPRGERRGRARPQSAPDGGRREPIEEPAQRTGTAAAPQGG